MKSLAVFIDKHLRIYIDHFFCHSYGKHVCHSRESGNDKLVIHIYVLMLLFFVGTLLAAANPDDKGSIFIEIYNRDQALIREIRQVDLDKGINVIDFHKIADGIYGHTANILPLKKQDRLETHSISYNYDLISHEKLISHFVGRWFSFEAEDIVYEGRLLRIDSKHLFLQPDTTDPMIEVVERSKLSEMFYPNIPDGLFIEPTLRWEMKSKKQLKELPVELSYLTSDIDWMCDYRAEIIGDDELDLSAVFSINNELPLSFPDAKIALVAGSTHRSGDPEDGDAYTRRTGVSQKERKTGQQRFFEYYRYPLDRQITLVGDQTIQIPFFDMQRVKVEKRFVFPHLLDGEQVQVRLRFENTKEAGIGRALPEGDIGLYKRLKDGGLSFLGEDFISATPVGKQVEINVGAAFDLSARRTRIAQARPQRDKHEETWRVEIIGSRNENTVVEVEQRVFGYYQVTTHEVNGQEIEYRTESANKLVFPVNVPLGGKAVLIFSLSYGY